MVGCAVVTGCGSTSDDWMTYAACHYDYGNRSWEWPYYNLLVKPIVDQMYHDYPISVGER